MILLRYVVKRLLMLLGGLALILFISFFAIYRLPGDPARMILGPRASAESIAEFRALNGLNDPVLTQFARFSWKVAALDLGESLNYRRPVIDLLNERSSQTLKLIGYAFSVLVVFAIVLPLCLRAAGLTAADNLIRSIWAGKRSIMVRGARDRSYRPWAPSAT